MPSAQQFSSGAVHGALNCARPRLPASAAEGPPPEALSELAALASAWGIKLSKAQYAQIKNYLADLLAYNRKTNLTAETDPRVLLLRHTADGLAALKILKEVLTQPSPRILDLGAGGGFIGLTIKIAWPQAQVTLMESLKRKFDFLNWAAARLTLPGLRVLRGRAGRNPLTRSESSYDAVVERALAPLPEALNLGMPLTAPGGIFLAFQSRPPDMEKPALKKALAVLGARCIQTVPYRLPLETGERFLVLFGWI
jgi:16S rRNA (guanine527-N7)-methyltransferase